MTSELHKPVIRKFKRAKVINSSCMNEFKEDNDNVRYILTVIDCFSRYAWAVPVKGKTGDTVLDAIKSIILVSGLKPTRLWIDHGKEFANSKTPYHTFG